MRTVIWQPDLQIDPKDPSDALLMEIDWTDRLGGETISTPGFTAPAGITVTAFSNTTTHQVLKISGGTPGAFYKITAEIDTANQHFERSFTLPVRDL